MLGEGKISSTVEVPDIPSIDLESHLPTTMEEAIDTLYLYWHEWNSRFFGGNLSTPTIHLESPSNRSSQSEVRAISQRMPSSLIRIRPSIFDGTSPLVKSGSEYTKGRFRVVCDYLLHEIVHQWQLEVTGNYERLYHGPEYAEMCNTISDALGLGRVRSFSKVMAVKNTDRSIITGKNWPHNVRPAGFYLGAYNYSSNLPLTTTNKLESIAVDLMKNLDDKELKDLARLLQGGARMDR